MPEINSVVTAFIEHKRALGRVYVSEKRELQLLVRFAEQNSVRLLEQITPAMLDDFLGSRPRNRPRSFNHLLGTVRGLIDWAMAQQLIESSPLQVKPRRVTSSRMPFLFDADQARLLLRAAAGLPDNSRAYGRGPTYRAIFALCYGLGLRAGEVCGLRIGDVDLDRSLLVVRGGKFGKSRLVPHGPHVAELLAGQLERRRHDRWPVEDDSPLFTFDGKRCIHPGTASQTFHHLMSNLGLSVADGTSPPCLHSLRHSFAVGCLLRWYRDGEDPAAHLQQLSTFLGHVSPESTQVYLTITPGLLSEANRRFEAYAGPAWMEAAR